MPDEINEAPEENYEETEGLNYIVNIYGNTGTINITQTGKKDPPPPPPPANP